MKTEDLMLVFMAKINSALGLEDDALRLRATRQAKCWFEGEYLALHGCTPAPVLGSSGSHLLEDDVFLDALYEKMQARDRVRSARSVKAFVELSNETFSIAQEALYGSGTK